MILDLLKYICGKLDENEIPYMISGSLAYNFYSIPRMTRDIDLIIQIDNNKGIDFIDAFNKRFYLNKNTIFKEIEKKGFFNIIDEHTGYKVDFIVRKDDEFRINEFSRRRKISVFGFDCYVVTIEDLLISKIIWIQEYQSEKQMEDILNLLKNTSIDWKYLKYWIEKLKLNTFNFI